MFLYETIDQIFKRSSLVLGVVPEIVDAKAKTSQILCLLHYWYLIPPTQGHDLSIFNSTKFLTSEWQCKTPKGKENFYTTKAAVESLKKKSLPELRYILAERGLNKELLRIRNLKLNYNGEVPDESRSFNDILYELKQSSSTTFWFLHNFYCWLLNAFGLFFIFEKLWILPYYLNLKDIDILFVTETWLDNLYDNRTFSFYG